ncbi:MAG: class I SAM-dependent methyltransferase [Acetobacteraceae bacterium]|jgi:tetratricopeptide (TPR) repeat protein
MDESLDAIGIVEGTDKSSIGHGYLRHYDRILRHLRNEPITLMEIGIFRGASLRAWSRYFDRAKIVGVDIKPECRQYATSRCEVEIGSQADPQFLDALGRKWRPDVIIDDGSHRADHVILTFRKLFPHLREGGIYIVEDLHLHSGPFGHTRRGTSDIAPIDLFLPISRLVACPEETQSPDRHLIHVIDSVEYFYGGVALRKKPAAETDPITPRRPLVEAANKAEQWAGFAMYILRCGGNIDEALACIRRAIAQEPEAAIYQHHLSQILQRKGDMAGALTAAREAVRLNPGFEIFQVELAKLEAKMPR